MKTNVEFLNTSFYDMIDVENQIGCEIIARIMIENLPITKAEFINEICKRFPDVSPSGTFTDEEIKEYIKTEYIDCKKCEDTGEECRKYKCPRYENIKIQDAFHLQLPTDFSLEKLYNALIKKMGESNSESK